MNNFCKFEGIKHDINMKNWRTTLAGIVLSAYPIIDSIMQAYTAGYFTDKTGMQLWLGIGFIIFGVLAKDHNVTGGSKPNNTTAEGENDPIVGDRPTDR